MPIGRAACFIMARTKAFEEKEILDKAVKLFSDRGYNGISMQELVDGLGINRSSLYDTFGDKEALYQAALKHYRTESTRKMLELINQGKDVRRVLTDIFNFVINDSTDLKRRNSCMMVNTAVELAAHEKKLAAIVNENMDAIEEALTQAIKRGQAEQQISKKHPARALARLIVNTISGFRVASKYGADRKTYDDIVRVIMASLD